MLSIDTGQAAAMPGVVRIFTASDVPGERGTGLNIPDLPVFVAVGETTCCVGDMFALVVADTKFHARQAAKKVKVDYDVYAPVTDPVAALDLAVEPRGGGLDVDVADPAVGQVPVESRLEL